MDYDEDSRLWFCCYKSWKKSVLAGQGKTPEAARADLMEKVKRETIQDDWG